MSSVVPMRFMPRHGMAKPCSPRPASVSAVMPRDPGHDEVDAFRQRQPRLLLAGEQPAGSARRPGAGRVDDASSANGQPAAADPVHRLDALDGAAAQHQPFAFQVIGDDRAGVPGALDEAEHDALRLVDAAVVIEQRAAEAGLVDRRLGRKCRGAAEQQRDTLVARAARSCRPAR